MSAHNAPLDPASEPTLIADCVVVDRHRYEALCEAWDVLRIWDAYLLVDGDQGDLRVDLLLEASKATAELFGAERGTWNPSEGAHR